MWPQNVSDQYWVDRQRDLTKPDRANDLVNSMNVTDRSELVRFATGISVGIARAGANFGKLVHSAVVRARQSTASGEPGTGTI
jgi:hypothetical protein